MSERRYWRPETEKILADLAMIRDAETKKLMIQPGVIRVTEDERKRIEERILDQIIQPVDFSIATSAKELERLTYEQIELLPMQAAAFDLQEYCRFRLLDERMMAEALAVYEPETRTE